MILNIEYNDNKYLTCYEKPLSIAIGYYNANYIYMFSSVWNFRYKNNKVYKDSGENIEMQAILNSIKKNWGFSVNVFKRMVLKDIKECLERKEPIVAYVDTYYCEWLPTYLNRHSDHHVLFVGYDQEGLFCFDKYDNQIVKLLYENYEKTSGECIILNKNKVVPLHTKDILLGIKKDLTYFCSDKYNMFYNMVEFSDFFRNEFNLKEETEGYTNIRTSHIFTWLNSICTSRKKYALFLAELEKNVDNLHLEESTQMLEVLYEEWYNLIFILLTCAYRNKFDIKQRIYISNRIKELSYFEFEVYNKLVLQFENYTVEGSGIIYV